MIKMVWSKKRNTSFKKNSIKNFIMDGNKIIKKEAEKPAEKRAVIYCRVSSKKQVDEWFWLETQEQIARTYCEKHDIIVDKVFREEGISWNKEDRKAFNDCVDYIKKTNERLIKITHFVCRDLSRIYRPDLDNIWVAFSMEHRIKAYGVEIVDIEWNTKDETDEDKLMKTLQYAYAWYQRKKIQRTCMTGKLWRLLQWYRPFPDVPRGYKRIKITWKWKYIDEIDWGIAAIIKEWLELFANDPNMSQAELHKFLVSKWLKVRKTYLEKMFQIHRLYFYAWYCIYPQRDVNELIEWRHEWIIDLATANKIKDKLQRKRPIIKRERKEDDNFILKHLITCKWCWRKLTWWTTTKKNWQKYTYYWCQKEWCPERVTIPQEQLENQIYEMIKECELSTPLKKLFDATLEWVRWEKEQDWNKIAAWKRVRLQVVKDRKKAIEDNILNPSISDKLKESLNEQWEELNTEEDMINEELENTNLMKINRNNSIKKIKEIVRSPLVFRANWDTWLKTQLLEVRFWNSLTCCKSSWVQTSDWPVLYTILRDLSQKSTLAYQGWDSNPHDREVTRFWV